jgi:hypothetical protein
LSAVSFQFSVFSFQPQPAGRGVRPGRTALKTENRKLKTVLPLTTPEAGG